MKKVQKLFFSSVVFAFLFSFSTGLAFAQGTDTGTVNVSKLNLRTGPGTTYKVVGTLDKGKQISILGKSGNWYRVKTSSGVIAWISKETISLKASDKSVKPAVKETTVAKKPATAKTTIASKSTTAVKKTAVADNAKAIVVVKTSRADVVREKAPEKITQSVVDFAKTFMGVKYVWGGSSPDGFDCSGFVKYVYNKFGKSLERVAANQAKEGEYIEKESLKPGDLVFFDTDGGHSYINHVGMYIGDGKFIHASSGHGDVVVSDLSKGFYASSYMVAKRFF